MTNIDGQFVKAKGRILVDLNKGEITKEQADDLIADEQRQCDERANKKREPAESK